MTPTTYFFKIDRRAGHVINLGKAAFFVGNRETHRTLWLDTNMENLTYVIVNGEAELFRRCDYDRDRGLILGTIRWISKNAEARRALAHRDETN